MKLAVATWQPRWQARPGDWLFRLRTALRDIEADRDTLVVLPEYAALEAALVGTPPSGRSAHDWMTIGAFAFDSYCDGIRQMVRETGATILGGSGFAHSGDDIVNRALFASPDGEAFVEKRTPTVYERDLGLKPGAANPLFGTRFGKVAVTICYDCEFPLISRPYAVAGADILLVPSCTDTPQGASRVRIGAQARALESQCLVAMAPLVGTVEGCDIIDVNLGQASVFCPPDVDQPEDGCLVHGPESAEGWAILPDLEIHVEKARKSGQVSVSEHWIETEIAQKDLELRAL